MEKVYFTEIQVGKLQQQFFLYIYISQRFHVVLYSDVFYDAI